MKNSAVIPNRHALLPNAESKKAMRLAHPNIVLVRDFDRDRGNVYMVMELLHGTPLDQLVLKQYPKGMPIQKVIDVVDGLGAALSYRASAKASRARRLQAQ